MSFFENAALVVPFSLLAVDFLILLINRLQVPIKGSVIIEAVLAFCLACFVVFWIRFRKKASGDLKEKNDETNIFNFTTWQTLFILISILLAVFIRASYLKDTIVPSATDLGHHMYWSQTIIDTGRLPDYGVPDFIIGEHMIFAAVNLLSGVKVTTAMPILILLLINLVGIFTLAILAGRMFRSPKIAAGVVFTTGLLYAVGPPQAKYVSGGVVGNIIGDMLIPVCLYFLYRAFQEKDPIFGGLAILFFTGLLYTHHLSAFILIYSIAAIVAFHLVVNFKEFGKIIGGWLKIFLRPFPLAVILFSAIFFLLIFLPSYFNPSALHQATGAPTKVTRVGLSFGQIESNAGSARLILGLLGFLLMLTAWKRKEYKYSFALAWAAILLLISWKPGWLYVNIPSDRIGNYLFLPFALLSAYGLITFFEVFRQRSTKFFSTVLLFILLFFVVTDGLADSADAFHLKNQFQEAVQTFHSAEYLANTLDTQKDVVLKDHVNVYGDSWYKLFFMKDYKYPLSRGALSRYIDTTKPRETCTRDMISFPASEAAQACYADTNVNYIAVNAQIEGASFEKIGGFSKVYASNYISIFKRD